MSIKRTVVAVVIALAVVGIAALLVPFAADILPSPQDKYNQAADDTTSPWGESPNEPEPVTSVDLVIWSVPIGIAISYLWFKGYPEVESDD